MNELTRQDLSFAVLRLPRELKQVMKLKHWAGKIFVGGGYLRATVANEPVNDADVFVPSKFYADALAAKLNARRLGLEKGLLAETLTGEEWEKVRKNRVHYTGNAITLLGFRPVIQIIHRWSFDKPADVINSFDFSVCCAAVWYDAESQWKSICDQRFYSDLAAKRLVYRSPVRIEEAGGSLLRVLKYYQKGYRIPLDSMGAVIARLVAALDFTKIDSSDESRVAKVLTGLLRVVDPQVDPLHEAHLPADNGHLLDNEKENDNASED